MKKPGYREMLRDRCPKVVNYALKWQKAKERWIDHVYTNFISIYTDKEERYTATRIILGISKAERRFDFQKSIDWDNLTDEETRYWKRVWTWVEWFRTKYEYIENSYRISKKGGKDEKSIKIEIIQNYLYTLMPSSNDSDVVKHAKYQYIDKFVNYLIECFEGKH